ncbi:MAG: AAA-like domain-containing protein [Bacteroidales bacterium]|nr:AAA-like domain-containing protein [Bacteroidales bacterium]
MKEFNTAGTCFPEDHYMVDISERVNIIRKMVGQGLYFCINRGRQYGKTTTLQALRRKLSDEYQVILTSFEGIGDSSFSSQMALAYSFVSAIVFKMTWDKNRDEGLYQYLDEVQKTYAAARGIPTDEFSLVISRMCIKSEKPVVLLIDEVDQAGNYDSFIKFLALLRNMYLSRKEFPTFQSVILAGVYDIKNLKLKIRDENEHQYNSPWNIAVPFDVDMSLHADGIAGMLREYQSERGVSFDEDLVANEIYAYSGGYPFLVSRLCQIIDGKGFGWDRAGVVGAVHEILDEHNTLFDDMVKKLDQFPELKNVLKATLFSGQKTSFNPDEKYIQLAERFGFIKKVQGCIRMSNRIFETRLYNLFTAEARMEEIGQHGSLDKNQFIVNGMLNMRRLIERFVVHYNDIYGSQGDAFKEKEGRRLFLLYLRPVINGVGNYYVEAETRDETRTDIVVDYLGHQYVIELKIWRGDSYNERGEQQLAEYLDYFHLDTGYLVSFCFNKNKKPEFKTVDVGGRTLYEAVV